MNLNSKYKEEYWNKRSEQRIVDAENLTTDMLKKLKKTYEKAYLELEKEINAFYGKYSTETGLDITEVRKRLDPKELKTFKEQLKLYYDEVKRLGGYSKDTKEYLRELSAKAYISRLDALQAQLRFQVETLYRQVNLDVSDSLQEGYKETYYKTTFDNQKGIGFAYSFNALDDNKVRVAISQNWQGSNFSDRIWNDKNKLIETINQKIPQGIALGQNPRKVARDLAKSLDTRYSNCERLARTEMGHVANQAIMESYKEVPEILQKYKFLATLDNRTSEICAALSGKVFLMSEAIEGVNYPEMHPNCRSTTIPYFDDVDYSKLTQIATDYSRGRSYFVPSNLSYKEWYNSLSKNQQKYFTNDKKCREQYSSDVKQAKEYRKLANKAKKMGYGDLVEGIDFKIKSFQQIKYFEPEKYEILKNNMKTIRNL